MNYDMTTIDQSPDYAEEIEQLSQQICPAFLCRAHDYHWDAVLKRFARFQLLFISGGDLIGVGHTVPLHWGNDYGSLPNTIEEVIISAIGCSVIDKSPNTLAALAVMVSDRCRGFGLSKKILTAMKQLAASHDLGSLLVPVRPKLKSRFPLTPLDQYVNWKRTDGNPFDPSLREHWEMGASVLGTIPKAVTVKGSVEEWENWTDMQFAESGEFIVEGALKPVIIDRANNLGQYEDPNVWMLHKLSAAR